MRPWGFQPSNPSKTSRVSSFPCTSCGACCREGVRIGQFPSGEDGILCYYQRQEPGGLSACIVYDGRPHICRVEETKPEGLTTLEWYEQTAEGCRVVIEREGLSEEWVPRISGAACSKPSSWP